LVSGLEVNYGFTEGLVVFDFVLRS